MTFCLFFSTAAPPTKTYTLSLHDALPIYSCPHRLGPISLGSGPSSTPKTRSEEHTSELQSPYDLVCRLLLEKKNRIAHEITERNNGDHPVALVGIPRDGVHLSPRLSDPLT